MFRSILIPATLAILIPHQSLAQDPVEGAGLYVNFCAACHGTSLQGDGPMAAILSVPPADLTALASGGTFPIFEVARRIDGRDPLVAHGGEMPIFGSMFAGAEPDVALSLPDGQRVLMARPIADLISFLMEVQS